MTEFQIMSYIKKIEAESKYKIHKGRRIKDYHISGTDNFIKMKKAREDLFELIKKRQGYPD
jgi:hypothetical protein